MDTITKGNPILKPIAETVRSTSIDIDRVCA